MFELTDTAAYISEFTDVLDRLSSENDFREFDYFIQTVKSYFLNNNTRTKSIAVIGTGIPEDMIYAAASSPIWILGGSRASSAYSDEMLPRDTDPVTRSALGFIKAGFAENTLILIPLVSDSSRKLAYILKSMGYSVQAFHFPPVKDQQSTDEWDRQYEICRTVRAKYLKKPLTARMIEKSGTRLKKIKDNIRLFLEKSDGSMNGSAQIFILGSFYCSNDINEWSEHLELLIPELGATRYTDKSKVILLGSPIYFPNYKLPFLIEDAGMEIRAQADQTSLRFRTYQNGFADDAAPAYVRNNSLFEKVKELISGTTVDGVIYHVLKGQIEYDFELERFERYFEEMNIPIIRLETDYNYQDIEQLRIRLEAFSEVLSQRKFQRRAVI